MLNTANALMPQKQIYTVSGKKCHYIFVTNFFHILTNFQNCFTDRLSSKSVVKRWKISHPPSNASLHYLMKYLCS